MTNNFKRILLILGGIFFCLEVFCGHRIEINPKTDMKGKPKRVEYIHFRLDNLSDTLTNENISNITYTEYSKNGYILESGGSFNKSRFLYNINNDLTNIISYDSVGNLQSESIYIYNRKRKLIERRFLCKDNLCDGKEIYEYIGNVIKVFTYDADGKLQYYAETEKRKNNKIKLLYSADGILLSEEISELDRNGNIVKHRRYNGENYLHEDRVWIYDRKGNLIEEKSLVPAFNGNITYKYDNRGNLVETVQQRDDMVFKWTIVYNDIGLSTEESYYENEILVSRRTFKYDSKKNWIEKTDYYYNWNRIDGVKRQIDYY